MWRRRSYLLAAVITAGVLAMGSVGSMFWYGGPFGHAGVSCTGHNSVTAGMKAASLPELQRLAQYQRLCGRGSIAAASFFAPTPTSVDQAATYADGVAAKLKTFASAGVSPVVFLEPTAESGNLNLSLYARGAYDPFLATYYDRLHQSGISDRDMGTWVLLPEGNLPEWSSVNPEVYSSVVNRTAQTQKRYFPGSKTAIMLDSKTYPVAGLYENGTYVSWKPYVQHISKGLIDSVGLQGFPEPHWEDTQKYLRTDFLAEAATILGIKEVWFNTGTFSQEYDATTGRMYDMPSEQRAAELGSVVDLARGMQQKGFQVSVHIFAQNKLGEGEKTDWSYWHDQPGGSGTKVFEKLVQELHESKIPLWIFDASTA